MSLHIEIPQPPRSKGGTIDPHEVERWLQRVVDIFTKFPTTLWGNLDMTGSKLSDIVSRTHIMLQNVLGWSNGSDTTQDKHISQANGRKWEEHTNLDSGNPHGTTAAMVPVTPAGGISETEVQAALEGLDARIGGSPIDLTVKTITTDPIGGISGQQWKLGTVRSATVALSTANYVEVSINGVVVKLAVVT